MPAIPIRVSSSHPLLAAAAAATLLFSPGISQGQAPPEPTPPASAPKTVRLALESEALTLIKGERFPLQFREPEGSLPLPCSPALVEITSTHSAVSVGGDCFLTAVEASDDVTVRIRKVSSGPKPVGILTLRVNVLDPEALAVLLFDRSGIPCREVIEDQSIEVEPALVQKGTIQRTSILGRGASLSLHTQSTGTVALASPPWIRLAPTSLTETHTSLPLSFKLQLTPPESNPRSFEVGIVFVQKGGEIDASDTLVTLPQSGSRTIRTWLRDRQQKPLTNAQLSVQIEWKGTGEEPVTASWNGTELLIARRAVYVSPEHSLLGVRLEARTTSAATPITRRILVKLADVVGFVPLAVDLNVMDDLTTEDLFGAEMRDEYRAARIRLVNDIKDSGGEYYGASILAFANSLEVSVTLEKLFDKNAHACEKVAEGSARPNPCASWPTVFDKKHWFPVDRTDFGSFISFPNSGPGQSPGQAVEMSRPPVARDADYFETITCTPDFKYRPYSAEIMILTVDRREERSTRGIFFRILGLLGTSASFAATLFTPGPDLILALDKYSNLFVPGLEKIWPSLKEIHRQNVLTLGMRAIEEVPFGSEISRVVFFPRKQIGGVLPGHFVRIAQVCPYYFKVKVALLKREAVQTIEQMGKSTSR